MTDSRVLKIENIYFGNDARGECYILIS